MDVRFEPDRVIEVWASAAESGTVGSGYLLGGGLILTAGHVTDRTPQGRCEARRLGSSEWVSAERVWRGMGCDAALLRIVDSESSADIGARLGRLGTGERVSCRALGFPFAQSKERGDLRDTEDLAGELAPLSGMKGGHLTVHIAGSVPATDSSGHSPWEGMSGAALFSGPLIVGIIVVDPPRFGTDRLEAVPIAKMLAEPGFHEALAVDSGRKLVPRVVEDIDIARGVLRQPYRPLPPRATPERLRRGATHFLVAAEYGVVPFHGREEELEELAGWMFGESGLEMALLVGAGGTGKTRLAAEVCRRAQAQGALVGFLEAHVSQNALSALGNVTAPLLVVIDEAPARLDDIVRVLIKLADAPSDVPLRVLLLARRTGEWWERLLVQRLGGDADAAFAYRMAKESDRELPAVDDSVQARERAFRAAAAAFALRMGCAVDDLPVPDMTQELFEQILFVHLAALSALDGERSLIEGSVVRADLLKHALQREERYWEDMAAVSGLKLTSTPRGRAVAVATLTVAGDEDAAASALTAVPDLTDASQEHLRDVARWLHELYPEPAGRSRSRSLAAASWFRPLTPVVLGDALVGMVLETAPSIVSRLLGDGCGEQPRRVLTVLTHAARTYGSAEQALRQAVGDHFEARWEVALTVAQEAGDPLGKVLALTLEHQPRPDLATSIEPVLPRRSIALREFAAIATEQALERARLQDPSLERDAAVARLANVWSSRLADLERRREALMAVAEAVEIYRRLAESNPGNFLSGLASSLHNQSGYLSRLGRGEDSVEAIEEAVEIYRVLADADPDPFLADLATTLNNQSYVLGQLRRLEDALAAIEEAVELYRVLADARPDAYLPDLATSLNIYAVQLESLGRYEDALPVIEDAVQIYQGLADARPDAFLADLAESLNNQSGCLSELRCRDEAAAAIEEAVAIYRRLAEARPAVFLPSLATALNTQAVELQSLRSQNEALAAIEEAVAIRRPLAEAQPDAFRPELALSLNNQSGCLSELGRYEEGLAVMRTPSRSTGIWPRRTHSCPTSQRR
jgi:tetratricopeptide (TPR) repeat protein